MVSFELSVPSIIDQMIFQKGFDQKQFEHVVCWLVDNVGPFINHYGYHYTDLIYNLLHRVIRHNGIMVDSIYGNGWKISWDYENEIATVFTDYEETKVQLLLTYELNVING